MNEDATARNGEAKTTSKRVYSIKVQRVRFRQETLLGRPSAIWLGEEYD